MRLTDFQAPIGESGPLVPKLTDYFRNLTTKVNGLAAGSGNAIDNALTAAPTTGTYAAGDFIHNSSKSELGAVSSKYVIQGWDCLVGGTPGTWRERRTLTGN